MSDKRYLGNIITPTPTEPAGSFQDDTASGTWSLQEAFTYVKAGLWPTAGNQKPLIEDVFSTYLYTGTSANIAVSNGVDLLNEGGLVWVKKRTSIEDHYLIDTERGANKNLASNTTAAETGFTTISTFYNDGFLVRANLSTLGQNYASWTFRKAPRFFDVVTYTGNGVSGRQIAHNLGVAPGCIIVKRTSAAEKWAVYHRSTTASPEQVYLQLHLTFAYYTSSRMWNDTLPNDAVFTVGDEDMVNASGFTYVAYLFAHDPLGPSGDGSDGLIACGSYTGNGSTTGPSITLGWEPQFVLVKRSDSAAGWFMMDTMRGMAVGNGVTGNTYYVNPNNSNAEDVFSSGSVDPTPTGFTADGTNTNINASGGTYIYIAIRRGPMRQPTSGTEVFAIDTLGGTAPNPPGFDAGFPVDLGFYKTAASSNNWVWADRLRGEKELFSNLTNAEASNTDIKFDYQSGWLNSTGVVSTLYSWMFRRAPGFFDVVAYTGTGTERQVPHGLGVTPEMLIIKRRDGTNEWFVHHTGLTSWAKVLQLESTGIETNGDTGGNLPTETGFPVTGSANVNGTGATYVAYLFATLPGVSKVGSYTGNGTSQTINCGFTSGARFVLIKRTDNTGDWYVWDSARGIVAGNDPHLSLNTTAAEVTTDDSVDADGSGFIVNQDAATNVNVSSASYIFLAIA